MVGAPKHAVKACELGVGASIIRFEYM
jgi:hypothetical protein